MQMRWDGGSVCLHLEEFVTTSQRLLLLPEKISRKNKNSSIVKKATKCCMCHSAQCSMIATVGVGTSGDKLVHLLIQIIKNNTPWGSPHNKLNTHYVISKSQIT